MPTYEYLCDSCGAFEDVQPMSAAVAAQPCPGCGAAAPRALLTAPRMALMPGAKRAAAAANERSRHAPMTGAEYRAAAERRHRAGCACCAPRASRPTADAPAAATKGSPAKRPWMVGH